MGKSILLQLYHLRHLHLLRLSLEASPQLHPRRVIPSLRKSVPSHGNNAPHLSKSCLLCSTTQALSLLPHTPKVHLLASHFPHNLGRHPSSSTPSPLRTTL